MTTIALDFTCFSEVTLCGRGITVATLWTIQNHPCRDASPLPHPITQSPIDPSILTPSPASGEDGNMPVA